MHYFQAAAVAASRRRRETPGYEKCQQVQAMLVVGSKSMAYLSHQAVRELMFSRSSGLVNNSRSEL